MRAIRSIPSLLVSLLAATGLASAQGGASAPPTPAEAQATPRAPSGFELGELLITGTEVAPVTELAVLPSLSVDLADVRLRSLVRRDLVLSGLFDVVPDAKAPPGLYGFDDPVDVPAWKKLGVEVIVKVGARALPDGRVEIDGLAYFLDVSKEPVYRKRYVVEASELRRAAHRLTDALIGAVTGKPGSFASHLTFASRWVSTSVVFTLDPDGHELEAVTAPDVLAIAPDWGPGEALFYEASLEGAPFTLFRAGAKVGEPAAVVPTPFSRSIYGVAFDPERVRFALSVAKPGGSDLWVAPLAALGSTDAASYERRGTTEIATHPAFGPEGETAWVGGDAEAVRRIYVDGKAVSPGGYSATAPTFCATAEGSRLVYAVRVAEDTYDLVMSEPDGRGLRRLTQNQGSNTYPACSPDGRLLAFFSTRNDKPGLYLMSLQRGVTNLASPRVGQSLRWAALSEPPPAEAPRVEPPPLPPPPVVEPPAPPPLPPGASR